jgi:DNA-directed RNA polymerase specialized sigma24 family protein
MMHYFKTTPLAVIAAIYGKNVAQIKMMLYRMRQKLKNYLLEEEIHL